MRTGAVKELRLMEQLYGFKYNDNSWLVDPDLGIDIMHAFMHDWMHVIFVNGTFLVEINGLL